MIICKTPQDMQEARHGLSPEMRVGFVPTMGALHKGHLEVLKRARAENDILVLSIFVNPTQFNNKSDFELYPNTWEDDLVIAKSVGVDYLFAPTYEEIYPDHYKYIVTETVNSKDLCGASRPGHFDGVLTIVLKLLNIISPRNAYFGEKDFQQLSLIKGMVEALYLGTNIVPVPIVREEDGLALSSRNSRLNEKGRALAPYIFEAIQSSVTADEAKQILESKGFRTDYCVDKDNRRFVAVFTNETKDGLDVRLIDNVEIKH
jgi:pantoate--beta-alanine ligase